jgi:hypothetical protein
MRRMLPLIVAGLASAAMAVDIPVQRVADDAKVIDRVAQASKRDLPQDLLKRIVNEDIEALRGRRADGTYDNATFDKLEQSRESKSFSVQPRKNNELDHLEMKGSFVYRLLIDLPSRRMLVTKNRRIYVDHVELEYIPINSSPTLKQNIKVEAWVEPGESRSVDFPEVARQATVRVFARADSAAGYGNVVLTLLHARVTDNADSPYSDAVLSAKAILRAIDNADVPSIRSMAIRIYDDLAPKIATPATQAIDVVATRANPAPAATTTSVLPAPGGDVYVELQSIEDLLTGNETEKRAGLDRLHQLVRRLRPR